VPPYWFVRSGDTYAEISAKTGLTVAELQAFNPDVDPLDLIPGERLNLWRHPPKPRLKPPGPMFWTVRPGQSFGLIAAKRPPGSNGTETYAMSRLQCIGLRCSTI
jgi:LysM domain